jgi:hypothetical protein
MEAIMHDYKTMQKKTLAKMKLFKNKGNRDQSMYWRGFSDCLQVIIEDLNDKQSDKEVSNVFPKEQE